jgi:hypothetical protein
MDNQLGLKWKSPSAFAPQKRAGEQKRTACKPGRKYHLAHESGTDPYSMGL